MYVLFHFFFLLSLKMFAVVGFLSSKFAHWNFLCFASNFAFIQYFTIFFVVTFVTFYFCCCFFFIYSHLNDFPGCLRLYFCSALQFSYLWVSVFYPLCGFNAYFFFKFISLFSTFGLYTILVIEHFLLYFCCCCHLFKYI